MKGKTKMSKQNAVDFLKKIESDPAFRKSVIQARNELFSPNATGTPLPSDFQALGFSIQDMHEAMYERGTKLSTAQLREITGGAEKIPDDKLEVIAFMHVYGVTAAVEPPQS